MTHPIAEPSALPLFGKLQQLLKLIAALRGATAPLTDPEGLRQTLELVLQLATLAGLDASWIARLRSVLEQPAVFDVVLALVRFVAGLGKQQAGDGVLRVTQDDGTTTVLTAADFGAWLPLVLQLIALLRQIRGEHS